MDAPFFLLTRALQKRNTLTPVVERARVRGRFYLLTGKTRKLLPFYIITLLLTTM